MSEVQRIPQTYTHLAVALIAVVLTIIWFQSCGKTPCPAIVKSEYKKRSDTSKVAINHKPVRVEGAAKITPRPRQRLQPQQQLQQQIATRYIGFDSNQIAINSVPFDSVEIIEPFTASIDTVSGKDTVSVQYDYPENTFRIEFKRAADSAQVINTTETITHYIAPEWYEKPSFTVPATAVTILAIFFAVR